MPGWRLRKNFPREAARWHGVAVRVERATPVACALGVNAHRPLGAGMDIAHPFLSGPFFAVGFYTPKALTRTGEAS